MKRAGGAGGENTYPKVGCNINKPSGGLIFTFEVITLTSLHKVQLSKVNTSFRAGF
jgi:hypothetical protein